MQNKLEKTKQFLKKSFKGNPSFSFNNWEIMYNHSLLVLDFSLEIYEKLNTNCDKLVLSIGALLHDIGKTYNTNKEVLKEKHDELGYVVSKNFILNLNLKKKQKNKLKEILSGNKNGPEKDIIYDADIIAFLADEKLQTAFNNWAKENNLQGEMRRKLNKINKLHFNKSREIAKPFYKKMKNRWNL